MPTLQIGKQTKQMMSKLLMEVLQAGSYHISFPHKYSILKEQVKFIQPLSTCFFEVFHDYMCVFFCFSLLENIRDFVVQISEVK